LLANTAKGVAQPFEVEIGGVVHSKRFTLICVCNGQSYGGAFTPVPEARPDDGMLDIFLVNKTSRAGVVGLVSKYAAGKYREIPKLITHLQDTTLTVRAGHAFPVNVDGEILRRCEVTFRLLPRAVNFALPKGAKA